jgi:hypothetical protein
MKKKGFLIIQRGVGVGFLPPWINPMKRIGYAKSYKEARRVKRGFSRDRVIERPISTEIKRGYGHGEFGDRFIESFRFENLITGKKWRDKK